MSLDKFVGIFSSSFPAMLESGLKNNKQGPRFVSQCYSILERAIADGQIGPDFMPDEIGFCKILTLTGYLEEHGNKMTPTYYVPTDNTYKLMSDSR